MYKITINDKSKKAIEGEELSEEALISMLEKFLKEEEGFMVTKQDIITTFDIPNNKKLFVMGRKDNKEVNIIHITTSVIVA